MRVTLVPPDPSWPARFERERQRIASVLRSEAIAIEHFGSTAIPGLAAKPVIDIIVARAPGARFWLWRLKLLRLGYTRTRLDSTGQGEGQWFFRDRARTRHLHVHEAGGIGWRRHLAFRDALRADPKLRDEYAALKADLASREWPNGQAYADAKTAFVRRVEAEAMRA